MAHYEGPTWHIETVDSDGTVGEYTSLALDAQDYPHISYFDASHLDMKYARWDGSAWQVETVDSEGHVGFHTSLALDATGNPHISYFAHHPIFDLKYARWDGSAWQIETVDSEGDVGMFTSLALDTAGNPHISYYDHTNFDLKYAHKGLLPIPETAINVFTDKDSYSAGETMHFGLDMTTANGGSAFQSYWLLILLRTPSTGVVLVNLPSLRLPSEWSYSNPDLITWTLPAMESGTYSWTGILYPAGEEPVVDSAMWELTGTSERIVSAEKALKRLGEVEIDLGR